MNIVRFYRAMYHDNDIRRQNRRALPRDVALYARNRLLEPLERALTPIYRDPSQRIGFIVGAPRSGTTLLFQLIARHLEVGYPSNFVARYWISPVAGSYLYLRRHRDAALDIQLGSDFGGTKGPHSPHEFSWFWEFRMLWRETDDLTNSELDRLDWSVVRSKLEALAGLYRAPYVLKSLNYTVYNVARFARELPQSRFLYIRRDPAYVVQSILKCRVERYGDERTWWTIRPRDVAAWLDREPLEQVCHQVADIRRGIEAGLAALPDDRKLVLDYEELVRDPRGTLQRVAALLGTGWRGGREPHDLSTLESGNVRRTSEERFLRIPELLEQCR
jgi:hypothetical protein